MSTLSPLPAAIVLSIFLTPAAFGDETTPGQGAANEQTAASVSTTSTATTSDPSTAPAPPADASDAGRTKEPSTDEASTNSTTTGDASANAEKRETGSAAPREESSAESRPAKPAVAAEAEDPKDRIVCKRVEVTGTRLRKGKVCKPLRVWETAEQGVQKVLRDADRRGGTQGRDLPGD